MNKTVFTIDVPRSNKYPRRIKTHNGGVPALFVYQEKLTWEENHLVAAQGFIKDKNLDGSWIAGKVEKGFSWTNVQFNMYFDCEKCVSNGVDIDENEIQETSLETKRCAIMGMVNLRRVRGRGSLSTKNV